jgi:hypothetical protein
MPEKPPSNPANHAEDFAHRYARDLDAYCAVRMEQLGLPERLHGTRDLEGNGRWTAFIARDRQGGSLLEGIAVNSGCLDPQLLKGKPGTRDYAKVSLRDRIDGIIAHEYEEDRLGSHGAVLKHGAKTALPVTDGARRILKAMGR